MIDWINDYNGFLMVIITSIYVIATFFICFFNWRSAKASREQIAVAQKEQKQNAGLQLYSMRKNVIHKIDANEFFDVSVDMSILFDKDINDEYLFLSLKAATLQVINQTIETFENKIYSFAPSDKAVDIVNKVIRGYKKSKEYEKLYKFIDSIRYDIHKPDCIDKSEIDRYIKALQGAEKEKKELEKEKRALVQDMKDFLQESIQ